MRIVKTAEERKNEILDVAEELFAQKGYDNASTNDIIAKIGIARGTLYHHFGSKEEILDYIVCMSMDKNTNEEVIRNLDFENYNKTILGNGGTIQFLYIKNNSH